MPDSKEFRQVKKNQGIVTNLPTTSVAWTSGKNVRFRPGAVMKALGKSVLATLPTVLPIRACFTFRGHDSVWRTMACCDSKIYSYTNDFGSYTDITPSSPAPTGGETAIWTFALIGGMPIISNSVNSLWKWSDYSAGLTALSNAPNKARAITSSLGRIMAGNIQDGAFDFKNRVKWTRPFKPTSWVLDTKSSADRQDLINPNTGEDAWETFQGFGRRGTKRTLLYTSKNIWKADAVESIMGYSMDVLYEGIGLIAPNARTNYLGTEFLMGETDFYQITDELKPIGFNIRNSVFPNINRTYVDKCFAFSKPSTREVVFCFPAANSTNADTAVAYNVELKNWTFYNVNFNCHTFGFTQTAYEWDSLSYGTWDSITDSDWDSMGATGILPYEIVGNDEGKLLKLEDTNNDNGEAIEAYIETGDMGSDQARIMAMQVVPFLKPTGSKNPLMIQIGSRESLDREIKWSQPKPFTEGVSKQVGGCTTGHFIRYRFFTDQTDSPWILEGFRNYFEIIGG